MNLTNEARPQQLKGFRNIDRPLKVLAFFAINVLAEILLANEANDDVPTQEKLQPHLC